MAVHPPGSSDLNSWFVALVHSGKERQAQDHLLASGFDEAFHPRRRSTTTSRGKTHELLLPVFRGYVLVRTFAFTPFLWHYAVRGEDHLAHGLVRGFIGGWPADPVPDSSISLLRSCCDAEDIWLVEPEPEAFCPYNQGDRVLVVDGLWQGHSGVVERAYVHGVWITLQTTSYLLYVPLSQVGPSDEPPKKLSRYRLPKRVKRGPYGAVARCDAVVVAE